MLFLSVLRGEKINMNKYTQTTIKNKYWAEISDKTGYKKSIRKIKKDKKGKYIIINKEKKYI